MFIPNPSATRWYRWCWASVISLAASPKDVCEAAQPGPVCFDVNSLHPEQSRGHYRVTIWSWS